MTSRQHSKAATGRRRAVVQAVLSLAVALLPQVAHGLTETRKLTASDAATGDNFGTSVSTYGTIAIIGLPWDDDNGDYSGSAYLFDVTTGSEIAKLLPDDGLRYDHFGQAVAVSSEAAIVGAPWRDDNGVDSGTAYIFEKAGDGAAGREADGVRRRCQRLFRPRCGHRRRYRDRRSIWR